MKAQFKNFINRYKTQLIVSFLLCIFLLIFVIPNLFFTLDVAEKKIFGGVFLIFFGIFMYIISPRVVSPSKQIMESPRTYKQLVDEINHWSYFLKKKQQWAYCYLFIGWIVLWIGRLSEHSFYSHPMFAVPVFAVAFIVATNSWEKENELDVNIAEHIIEGIKLEKKHKLNSTYFQDLMDKYTKNIWGFTFVRISPIMMILFSLFNAGPLSFFIDYLSTFFVSNVLPTLIVYSGSCLILSLTGRFYAKAAAQPYKWLLWKLQAND